GATYQAVATAIDLRRFPPQGRLVDVGGYRLHLHSMGIGSPVVVLDAGLGGSSLQCRSAQRWLALDYQVCAFDRAGLGWSEAGPNPRDSSRFAGELHELLKGGGVHGPIIYLGHSLGGRNARAYAARYRGDGAAGG